MTKHDYKMLADIIHSEIPYPATTVRVAETIARELDKRYSNFDRAKFIAAATRGV